jgi:hypothetical protein
MVVLKRIPETFWLRMDLEVIVRQTVATACKKIPTPPGTDVDLDSWVTSCVTMDGLEIGTSTPFERSGAPLIAKAG